MRKRNMYLLTACLSIGIALTSCNQKKEKITDIPFTTQSADAKASLQEGLTSADQGDAQKAKALYTKAISQDPKLAIAYILKASTNETPKEFAEDLANAKANLEGASEWEKLYYDYLSSFMSGDWDKRLEITQKIASLYPDAARAQVDLGTTYEGGNQEAKARECFEKAVALNPNWVGGYKALQVSYLFIGPKDLKKAEENALKVVQLAPASAGAQVALGDCYRGENDLQKARDAYSKAIELDPSASEPYYKKGNANSFLGNLDEARQNFTDGGKHDDTRSGAVTSIANTYLYGNDYKAAMNLLCEQAAGMDASGESKDKISTDKYNCLSSCASIAMHYGDAAKLKEVVALMDPLSTEIGNDLGSEEAKINQKATMLYWASVLAATEGNMDVAKAKAEEMKTMLNPIKNPNKLDPYEFALGYICMKEKNYSDAVKHFEKTQPDNVYNKYWLAMSNEAAGNKDKANSLNTEISNYNFNEVGNALIRNEVKSKLATR